MDGALVLDQIIDPDLIERARVEFLAEYADYLALPPPGDALIVGDRRIQVPVRVRGRFADTSLFGNPFILSAVGAALDEDVIMGNYGVVVSLPGAPDQHVHSDGVELFPKTPLDPLLPSWAITVAIPLLAMNLDHGSTEVHLGSHRKAERDCTAPCSPDVPEGSCLMWSYRVRHRGTANRSDAIRPLLVATYQRSWFFDDANYNRHAPLHVPEDQWYQLSDEHRRLLRRAAPLKD
jgi:ectoine hydroxylase-related dioxygenase (phytanoyl-CoA dioxygenase family)